MNTIKRDAVFSADGRHRFELSRIWDESKGLVLFVGLNPSKAGRDFDDMTVRKGIGFARRWGYGGTLHGNAFSRIATDPKELVGFVELSRDTDNANALVVMALRASLVVAAWGAFHRFRKHFDRTLSILPRGSRGVKCLGVTKDGFPRHISRLAYATPLVDWRTA